MEIKKQFLKRYDAKETDFASLPPYGAAAFNSQLKSLMISYGTTKAGKEDAIGNVQQEIESVRDIMTENIERVLERGERIDLLVDKTDRLGVGAHDFRVRSRGLKRRMWWKNVKLMVLLGVVIVFLLYLFIGFGCGLPGMFTLIQCSKSFKLMHEQHGVVVLGRCRFAGLSHGAIKRRYGLEDFRRGVLSSLLGLQEIS